MVGRPSEDKPPTDGRNRGQAPQSVAVGTGSFPASTAHDRSSGVAFAGLSRTFFAWVGTKTSLVHHARHFVLLQVSQGFSRDSPRPDPGGKAVRCAGVARCPRVR